MKKKKILVTINIVLVIAIVIFAFFKFQKTEIIFDCQYGTFPDEVLKVTENYFYQGDENGAKVIFIFNRLPDLSIFENIDKLYKLFGKDASFYAIFTQRFRSEYNFEFPFKILKNFYFACKKDQQTFDKNYFLFVRDKKLLHIESTFDFIELNFIIQKKLNSGFNIFENHISSNALKDWIVKRINESELELLNLNTGALEKCGNLSEYKKIYFFHANCSSCQLKEIIKDIRLKSIFNQEKVTIIFSVFANRVDLKELLDQNQINSSIYIDYKDEFLLSQKYTNDKENPMIITGKDFGRPNE